MKITKKTLAIVGGSAMAAVATMGCEPPPPDPDPCANVVCPDLARSLAISTAQRLNLNHARSATITNERCNVNYREADQYSDASISLDYGFWWERPDELQDWESYYVCTTIAENLRIEYFPDGNLPVWPTWGVVYYNQGCNPDGPPDGPNPLEFYQRQSFYEPHNQDLSYCEVSACVDVFTDTIDYCLPTDPYP